VRCGLKRVVAASVSMAHLPRLVSDNLNPGVLARRGVARTGDRRAGDDSSWDGGRSASRRCGWMTGLAIPASARPCPGLPNEVVKKKVKSIRGIFRRRGCRSSPSPQRR
jgi:hypothetical protein